MDNGSDDNYQTIENIKAIVFYIQMKKILVKMWIILKFISIFKIKLYTQPLSIILFMVISY